MKLELNNYPKSSALAGESEFSISVPEDPADDGSVETLRVHPWSRRHGNGEIDDSVFVSVGWFMPNGEEPDGLENSNWNIIVDRNYFVEGLLHAFPELKRA